MSDMARRSAHLAIGATFFMSSVAFGNWLARIPEVRDRLHIDDAVLGVCLLGMSVGSVLATTLAGTLIWRMGSRRGTRLGYGLFVLALCGPGLAPSPAMLFLAVVPLGVGWGILQISMNTSAHELEQASGTRCLARCHGAFSLGGMVGAGLGSCFAHLGVAVAAHLAIVSSALLLAGAATSRSLHVPSAAPRAARRGWVSPPREILGLSSFAFLVLLVEGAIADWSSLLLRDDFAAPAGLAGLGFAIFSVMMAAGRLGGDWLSHRLRVAAFLRIGTALGGFALVLGLVCARTLGMLLGLGFVGLGLANVVPIMLRAAGSHGERQTAINVAAVATFGQVAFLVGPPMIGLLSRAFSVSGAFWALAVTLGLASLVATPAVSALERAHTAPRYGASR